MYNSTKIKSYNRRIRYIFSYRKRYDLIIWYMINKILIEILSIHKDN
jgi:hypothetical protein